MAYDPQRSYSQYIGFQAEPITGTYARDTVSSTATDLVTLGVTISDACDAVDLLIETGQIRYTTDGTTPTTGSTGNGFLLTAGDQTWRMGRREAIALKLIRVSADSVIHTAQVKLM